MTHAHEVEAKAFFFLLANATQQLYMKIGVYPRSLTLEYMVHSVNLNHIYVAI